MKGRCTIASVHRNIITTLSFTGTYEEYKSINFEYLQCEGTALITFIFLLIPPNNFYKVDVNIIL